MTQTLTKTITPQNLKPGDWVFLHGDLGAGKTFFTQQICQEMGVQDAVLSPTYSLMNIYSVSSRGSTAGSSGICLDPAVEPRDDKGIEKILHLDLYRLKSPKEICSLGLDEEFDITNTIAFFEWPSILTEQDWEHFFQFTNCQRPLRIHNINV